MNRSLAQIFAFFSLTALMACTGPQTPPPFDLNGASLGRAPRPAGSSLLRGQHTEGLMSLRSHLPQALHEAQQWRPQAYLIGAYSYQFGNRYFLNYDFQAGGDRELAVKVYADGRVQSREAEARGRPQPLSDWNLNTQQILRIARDMGLNTELDYSIGLSNFSGMGITHPGPKWSALHLSGPSGFVVIDDLSQERWFCDQVTADSGCEAALAHAQSQHRAQSHRDLP